MNASTVRDERLQMLGPQHAAAMYEIERQCFPLPWSEEQCAAAFGQKAFSALGMFRHEALIGYISVYHTLDELEILNLAVLPDDKYFKYMQYERYIMIGLMIALFTGVLDTPISLLSNALMNIVGIIPKLLFALLAR